MTTKQRDAFRQQARTIMEATNDAYKTARAAGKKVQVHHEVPLEWSHVMGEGFNPNALDNLAVYESSIHTKITTEWSRFKMKNLEPNKAQIEKFVDYIRTKYKDSQIK